MSKNLYANYLKRLIDFAVALVLAVMLLPIALALALAIKISSRGPVVFKQKRSGKHGHTFMMYKFRSMAKDNDVMSKDCADKVTKVGSFMRKTSLDELPQIINVLKGDMSFIGPRPWITEYRKHFTRQQKLRNNVRPGITGRAQAYGRNALSIHDKIKHDLEYVEGISFREDARIILQTLKTLHDKSVAELGKSGIHEELAELRAQWHTMYTVDVKNRWASKDLREDIVLHQADEANPHPHLANYTVLMCIYKNDKPGQLKESIDSILLQTVLPDEFIIISDGPISQDLENVVNDSARNSSIIKLIKYKKNRGLGPALADGIKQSSNELIARMDADDISDTNRCEHQLRAFADNDGLSIVGTNVAEFDESKNVIINIRKMPESNKDIQEFSRRRNPFAHPSVMVKKSSVIAAGNYRSSPLHEDYDLWVRMLNLGMQSTNIQSTLLKMRVSDDFYFRRGGVEYLKAILSFKYSLLRTGYSSPTDFIISGTSSVITSLAPKKLRRFIYSRFLRAAIPHQTRMVKH